MTPDIQKKVCEFISLAGSVVEAAVKQADDRQSAQAKIEAKIPSVVDALVNNKRLDESLRKEAEATLKDHLQTLEVLANTAAHRSDAELAHLGKPVGHQKKASYVDATSPWVGSKTAMERESDVRLLERLGIR